MKINDTYFNATLEEILNELVAQLRANGIQLLAKQVDTPNDIQVCCPYHKDGLEKKPSAGIRKSDGLFHCFACGEVHALNEVVSYCFGYHDDPLGAIGWHWLIKNFATVSVENRKPLDLDLDRQQTHPAIKYVSEQELDSYRYIHPYMYKRRLTDDIIELFDIGYDKQTQCITFPIRDEHGGCLFIARRSVHTKYFNYPSGAEKPLYGLYELSVLADIHHGKWENEIIVCESMLDALTAWVYGKYAVALNGLGSELQFKQLRDLPCRKLILATDNDEAGLQARERIRKNVTNKIITEYCFPVGKKDLNDLEKWEFDELKEIF